MAKKKRKARGQVRTNTMRFLDAHQVSYEVKSFSSDIHSTTEAAEAMGVDPSTVYKTLVVERVRGKPLLVMLAGDKHVDLGVLAASVGEKKLRLASHRDAETLTGLQVGGISALALINKGFDICIDCAAQHLDQITISAGQRGLNLCLPVKDLVRVTQARWVKACSPDPSFQLG
jgi:Cys-tRNA(Pro)/Cys-tRNA(Cys) deacylase